MKNLNYLAVLCSLAATFHGARGVDTATVSITAAPDFTVQQVCVKNSIFQDELGVEYLGLPLYIGCASPVYNACFCTSVVQPKVSSVLANEISINCAGTAQLSEAISVYNDYCVSAGYPRSGESVATTTAGGAVSTSAVAVIPAKTSTTVKTANAQTSAPTGQDETAVATGGDSTPTTSSISSSGPSSGSSSGSSSSGSSSSGSSSPINQSKSTSKPPVGAIVGGVLGGLAIIAVILLLVLLIMRNKPAKSTEAAAPPPPVTTVNSEAKPEGGSPYSGRAELDPAKKDIVPTVIARPMHDQHQMEGRNDVNTYGLRPDELDGTGRNIAQLHGDGRYPNNAGVELPGSDRFGGHSPIR